MATVESPCEDCEGRRFQDAVLEYELAGKNIADVLEMSMSDALDFFATDPAPHVQRALELGATHAGEFDEYGTQWTTLSDPEGNVFDIGLAHQD